MAFKVDYFAKETGKNLVRNPWLTVATVVIVFVAVLLVGVSLLVRSGMANATKQWEGGVEFIIYMNVDATPEQIESVSRDLDDNPQVERAEFMDKNETYADAQRIFVNAPELLDALTPADLPTSFRVKPIRVDPILIDSLVEQFGEKPGVREVVAASRAIRDLKSLSDGLSTGILVAASLLAVASVVMIGITIQTAVFARRREIEVMKLVGATNWFIRVPFMLEGVLQGVIGAGLGIAGIRFVNYLRERNAEQGTLNLLSAFDVTNNEVLTISLGLLGGGILVSAFASALAVTFYVKV